MGKEEKRRKSTSIRNIRRKKSGKRREKVTVELEQVKGGGG